MSLQLLSVGADAKTVKGEQYGWLTFILYLAAHVSSGFNVCPFASAGCAAACLFKAGRGRFRNVEEARIRKTLEFFTDRAGFLSKLNKDIEFAVKYAEKRGMKSCFRLNGTSDINWTSTVISKFPELQFYDYTKNPYSILNNDLENYHLTFSRSEENEKEVLKLMEQGHNVAVVFRNKELPSHWHGVPVINGDQSDLRFLDPKGVIVGLKAKGDAKKDESGFVVDAMAA